MSRLFYLFREFQQFEIIAATFENVSGPFFSMGLAMYVVYNFYAVIGQAWFGGKITMNSAQTEDPSIPALYYLMNFNCFASSLITLFTIMVINNWYNTTNSLCDIAGNNWPRLFTFSFIMVCVWIFLSVLIAFVLEIYGNVAADVEQEFKRRIWIEALRTGWKDGKLNAETRGLLDEAIQDDDGGLDERVELIGQEVKKQRASSLS